MNMRPHPSRSESIALGRRPLIGALLTIGAFLLLPAVTARSQDSHSGGSGGKGGSGGSHSSGRGESSSGGHTSGGGESSSAGHTSGGGEEGGGKGAGRTPQQRAYRHRQRTGRLLGGGVSHGGHATREPAELTTSPSGSTAPGTLGTGEIGGDSGGEHFVHDGPGYWGADGKVLRR